MYAEIIVDIAHAAVDKVFTYRLPEGMALSPGTRVRVPFGRQTIEGFLLSVKDTAGIDESKVRDVIAPLEDYPALLPELVALAKDMAADAHCPLAETLRMMLPAQMRGGRVKVKTETVAKLLVSGERLAAAMTEEKRSPKRKLLLELLSDGEEQPLSELSILVKSPREPLRALADKGLVAMYERETLRSPYRDTPPDTSDPALTEGQREALSELLPALSRGEGAFLLFGVTGSGKTEVYIRLIRECLKLGKGAIVLVPEIVLTPQMTDWFRARFGDVAAVLHSRLSAGERFDEWRRIRRGDARVVIGARSAVFAPVSRLGCVVVDEEHEPSYQSEHFPQYDARDIAQRRAEREGALLLMASATPSILSFARAHRGDLSLLEMDSRVLDRALPTVTVVDMREETRLGNRGIFSELLAEKLKACVEAGQQAMLFLNRRGYAPFVSCRSCGKAIACAQCDVSMTYHQQDDSLHCHYCGARAPMPSACPACGSAYIRTVGIGTQRVEDEVRKLFPGVGVIRMDMDTTATHDAHYTLLKRFREREAQVLVGTQMIAKGLDFPQVTLVGAVLADLSLNLPDYRAPERTFQLLTQVAGRAGRGGCPGEVVIQTYDPTHYAVEAASRQDYRAFFEQEFARRKRNLYPPFTMMARLLCRSQAPDAARETAEAICAEMRAFVSQNPVMQRRVIFLRADDAPIKRIEGYYRAHVLCRLLVHHDSAAAVAKMRELAERAWNAEVTLTIDPSSMA